METDLNYIYVWAVYLGLFVTTSLAISSMLFLVYYIARAVFFWRYSVVANRISEIMTEVMNNNRKQNPELAFIAGTVLMILKSEHFTQESLEELKEELQINVAKAVTDPEDTIPNEYDNSRF